MAITLRVAAIALLLPVAAALPDEGAEPIETASHNTEDGQTESLAAFEKATILSDDELNAHRAREHIEVDQITINDQTQDGDVTDNVAIANTNGDNLINGDAFTNSSGFMSTVQNTGNNVLIQNSTIINVSIDVPAN